MTKSRIVFLTREPVVHQLGGSTTCALNLLELLARQGAEVTMVVTSAYGRSPRLWFRVKAELPEGVRLFAPGFLRLGKLYLNVFSRRAWARFVGRLAVRARVFGPLARLAQRFYGEELYTNAWDLTTPTQAEREAAVRAIECRKATTVVVNYAFWAPLLSETAVLERKRVILMHDLLSARVQGFLLSGMTLDCPVIDEATEMSWLDRADCVLAAQQREAEVIQPKVSALVLVQPIVFHPRALAGEPEAQRCLFVGSNIPPNQIGLGWFLEQVWPVVRAGNPKATLAVVGTVCQSVEDGVAGVVKVGSTPSIEAEYAKAAVCLVPLRIGSGIKIKLIEALSFGKATVSTSVGIQGLEDWAPNAVEVADDAAGFAAAVLHLLADAKARKRLEAAALTLSKAHYNAETALDPRFVAAVL